ncbi:MAG: CapA family protein, partial [Hyphomicrobiaceae bacterium]
MRRLLVYILTILALSSGSTNASEEDSVSIFLAGDMIVMRPFADVRDDRFLQLVSEIRSADVAFANLETLFHEYKGYPQAHSGGTYMATPPEVARDLAWAGLDIVSAANNHTFDFGAIGVMENLDALAKAGILSAGAGKDLQQARAVTYFDHPKARIGLISAASTFVSYGLASTSRSDQRGRPGLNPLRTRIVRQVVIPEGFAEGLANLAESLGFEQNRFNNAHFNVLGFDIARGREFAWHSGRRPYPDDSSALLRATNEASTRAELTIVSIHAHDQGEWLRRFAHRTIDNGADIFIAHGPHRIEGIEIYKGRPIFYCLGDFFFGQHHIERLPSEYYDKYRLDENATVQDAIAA